MLARGDIQAAVKMKKKKKKKKKKNVFMAFRLVKEPGALTKT